MAENSSSLLNFFDYSEKPGENCECGDALKSSCSFGDKFNFNVVYAGKEDTRNRGCAGRIADEVEKVITPNGSLRLIINDQSGRHFNDVNQGQLHLENAANVLQIFAGKNVEVVAKWLDF